MENLPANSLFQFSDHFDNHRRHYIRDLTMSARIRMALIRGPSPDVHAIGNLFRPIGEMIDQRCLGFFGNFPASFDIFFQAQVGVFAGAVLGLVAPAPRVMESPKVTMRISSSPAKRLEAKKKDNPKKYLVSTGHLQKRPFDVLRSHGISER